MTARALLLALMIVSVAFLFFQLVVNAQPGPSLTLQQVFKAAVEKTESIPIARSQLQESESRLKQARSAFLPELSAVATYQQQEKDITSLNATDQLTGKVSLTQSLFAGGKDQDELNSAQAGVHASRYELKQAHNALYVEVARSFYELLSANREVENIKKSIQLTEVRIGQLEKRKKIGKSRNIEVLAAQAQLSTLQAQLLSAVGEQRIGKNNFANATGLSRDTQLDDANYLPEAEKNLQQLLTASDQRPDVLALQEQLKSTEYNLSAVRAEHLPSLDLSANAYPYRYRPVTTANSWDASLVLSLPLFSGGLVQAKTSEALQLKN